jgi:hypothetical protein
VSGNRGAITLYETHSWNSEPQNIEQEISNDEGIETTPMAKPIEKLMSAPEAVRQFVNDGDHLIIGNYTVSTCMELVFEIIRQGKKGFTLYSQSGILDVEMLVAAGAVERLVTTYLLFQTYGTHHARR